MKGTLNPYELPELENHLFFFINQHILPQFEASLHRYDLWELDCVIKRHGVRMVGDTMLSFEKGEVAQLTPGIHHQWEYDGR